MKSPFFPLSIREMEDDVNTQEEVEDVRKNNSVKKAKVISVVQVEAKIGTGTKEDPVRNAIQYWDLEGNLLFILDPYVSEVPEPCIP